MRAKQFCALTTTESRAKMAPVKCIYPPPPRRLCGSSVVVDFLFWFVYLLLFCVGLCFGMHNFMSFPVLTRKRELVAFL